MTGAPERAYEVFVDVVKNLFEWDETTHRGQSPPAQKTGFTLLLPSVVQVYIDIGTRTFML